MKKKMYGELAASGAFLILGVFWLLYSSTIKITAYNSSVAGTPRVYPQIVSVLVIAVSLIAIAEQLYRLCKLKDETAGPKESLKRFLGVAIVTVVATLYCVFITKITYLPATMILSVVVAYSFEIRKPVPLALLSLVMPAALFFLFRYLLVVPLP